MIAGFVPNFYVAYDFQRAAPDPASEVSVGLQNAHQPVHQQRSTQDSRASSTPTTRFPATDLGPAAYFKRFGQQSADTGIATILSGAILPIVFRQDPRYFYMGQRYDQAPRAVCARDPP